MDQDAGPIRKDGWVETEATITNCKRTLISSLAGLSISYEQGAATPEFRVQFSYVVANKAFTGWYVSHSEQVAGETFTIAYDPLKPERNTGADLNQNIRIRIFAWTLVGGLTALALWLGLPDDWPF